MNFIENNLVDALKKALKDLYGFDAPDNFVMLEIPQISTQGDYATNLAMRLTKELKKNPRDIAQEIVGAVEGLDMLEKVEVAGPGFINFFIKPSVLADVINIVLKEDDRYGSSNIGNGEKFLVEYVSANPTGPLHVGHARGAAWGDALTRILTFAGYDVLREFYINDLGNQITNLSHSLYARYKETLGLAFVLPEDGYHGPDIIEIAKEVVKAEGDKWVDESQDKWEPYFKDLGIKLQLERIEKDLGYFRVEFDSWVSEKSLYDDGRVIDTLNKLKDTEYTYEAEGALWFKSTEFGDDKDRVLIKSDGSYTYLVPDIANHLYKLERGYHKLLNLWGGDHHGYIARMKAALESFGYKDVLDVDIIQMVRLIEDGQEVKMSKRTGNAVGLVELAEDISIDAARYFFVSRSLQTPLDFDLNLARSQTNENPVYYAQYAHARISSLVKRVDNYEEPSNLEGLIHPKEIELLKMVNEFPKTVASTSQNRNVQNIPNYIHSLSQMLHSYYGEVKINDQSNIELTSKRIKLLVAVQTTLRNALNLIGVSAPESM
ncbi:MAG TPA: arginine--tRNA ligase [Erysipelothrix sp.]|nr:arginine--tRNA ligase [Erysipelothrix sp.]